METIQGVHPAAPSLTIDNIALDRVTLAEQLHLPALSPRDTSAGHDSCNDGSSRMDPSKT